MKTIQLTLILTATALFAGISTVWADSAIPKTYPLKTCPVSDDKLGEHGKSVKVTYQGVDVYLCCKDCVKDFNKNPAKYVKMVKDASAKK